ncbi:MAG TPA: tRNA (adenosine(37)-N6)-dimethylallyltransferase MiaA, partial [Spirochaetales bacterium]|nr:tRNA (adenosine(37)-N6)-dimethylallyltransferase MiaA [Spirochaetales bacterium]
MAKSCPWPRSRSLTRPLSTNSSKTKVLVLAGPTAVGKTELLAKTFGAEAPIFLSDSPAMCRYLRGAEVVSADCFQAYRGMDIGTAKPDAELRRILSHYLIDFLEPDQQYTAGDFVRMADNICNELWSQGRLPVVSGGTGFYLRNFICGPASGPASDPEIRNAVQQELQEKGIDALRAELAAADPLAVSRIAYNDTYRLTRAVEILRATGRPPSVFAPSKVPRDKFDFLVVGLCRPREELNARIEHRVDNMFEQGLAAEVESLIARGYDLESPGMQAIGYKEFLTMPGARAEEIKEAIVLHTRQYAKRQMTFFRSLPGIVWIEPSAMELLEHLESFLNRESDQDDQS